MKKLLCIFALLVTLLLSLSACKVQGSGEDECEHTSLSEWKTEKAASCTEAGEKSRHCLAEGCDYTEKDTIPKLGHDIFNYPKVDATCEAEGSTAYETCSRCDYATTPTVIEKLPHTPSAWITDTASTCHTKGSKHKECQICKEVLETIEIDMTKHSYGSYITTTEPTCTAEGTKTKYCENDGCNAEISTSIEALGHDLKNMPGKDASCTEAGYTAYKDCSRCDHIEGKDEIKALGHRGDDMIIDVQPTCTEPGLQHGVCDVCGETLDDDVIPALGHDMDAGVVTTAPGCESTGIKTFTCQRNCGHTETKPIPALGHDMDAGVITTAPGCESTGIKTFTCQRNCGHTTTAVVDALNHDMGDWENVDAITQRSDCSRCDYFETRPDPDAIVYGDEYLQAYGDMGPSGKLVAGRADINTDKHLIFTAKVDSFSGLRLGHGYANYTSAYLEIDNTYIKYYWYTKEHILQEEKTHGLNIEGDIKVTIDVNHRRVATIRLESNGESFEFSTGTTWYGSNGEIFAESLGSVLTGAQLAFTCDGYADDIHFYGDSYLSHGSDGWLKFAFDLGHTDGVFDGYGGRGSGGAIASLIENLKHSSPKLVVWMLGMNDGSDTDINTPSKGWATNRDKLIALSEEYGFELVFTTIPTVPNIYHEGKNKWIRESGYRYIEMAGALGADGTGKWTDGFLKTDNVHPTKLGAEAIFNRASIDVPELVGKCYHVVSDWTYTEKPNCTLGGERTGVCTKCSETVTEAVSALGHDMDEGTVTLDPNCTEAGIKTFTCVVCGHTATESIDPTGHDMSNSVVVTPPTCTSEGVLSALCQDCGNTVTESIAKLKHSIGVWVTTASGARERVCSGCDYKETDYIINFENGYINSNDRITVTPGAASSGAAAPEAVGPTSSTAGSISTKLEIRDNVAGKIGEFVLYIAVDSDPTKASSYASTTAVVELTNDNTTGDFLMFEMQFKNMTSTNSGGPVLFSLKIGENVFNVYPNYGGHYGTGLNFGIGGRNILYNYGAYTNTPESDSTVVLPFGEWITLRLLFDIEAGEMKTFVKSSKTNNLMTHVSTTTTENTKTKIGSIEQQTAAKIKTTGLDSVSSATITFNNTVCGVNSTVSENAYDNISFMRMDYAECPHSAVSDWTVTLDPTCDNAGKRERTCLDADCAYTEVEEISALGHTLGSWYDIGNNEVRRDCENCTYFETQSVLGYTPSGALMSLKGGANSVVVLIHDDGYVASMEFADRMFTKYGLVGDVAMMVDNVMNGANYRDAYIPFKHYLSNGNWGLINHSYTHGYWGEIVKDTAGNVIDVIPSQDKIYREVVTSAEKLRELFPGHRVLTFAYPGISSLSNPLGFDKVYNEIRAVVEQYCIAGRGYSGGEQSTTGISWDMTNCGTLADGNAATVIKNFENFAYGDSKLAVYLSHGIADGQNHNITAENFEAVCAELKTYVDAGTIWNAHYEDAALYIREAETATLSISGDVNEIKVTLTDTLDNSIYNYPLTVRLEVPYNFAAVKVVQGDRTTYALAKDADGKWVCDVEVVPDGGVASVTRIAIEDIPETPDEPTVTPPAGDEDDGLFINSSTNFSNANGLTTDVYSSIVENFDAIHGNVVKYEKATNADGSGKNTSWVPSSAVLADAMEATFDIYIDKAGTVANGMAFQIYFATVKTTPFTAVIKTDANGFCFGALSSASGGSTTYCTSSLAYDTWHTVTIKINMSSNEHFKATFYADGNEIGSSKVFTNYDKVADAVVNHTVSGIYFQSNSSAKTFMYLDNISIKAGTLEALGMPKHGEYHFESSLQNVANANGFLTPSLSKIGENKTQSLKLVKQIGADHIGFYPTLKTTPIEPEAFGLTFDMYLPASAADAGKLASIYFNSVSASSPIALDIVAGEDGFTFGGDATTEAISFDKWHIVKLLVNNETADKFNALVYVDGALAGEAKVRTVSTYNKAIDGVYVVGAEGAAYEMYLDNLTFKSGTVIEVFEVYEKYGLDVNYFPGWTRKSLTFTLDDGILANDERVLDILRPAGILGTFNLYGVNVNNAEKYRELYEGYGIANHCNYHALFFDSQKDYNITDEPWPGSATADTSLVYKHPTVEGLYYYFVPGYSWHPLADVEHYLEFAMQTEREIEEIFGEGVVKGFIYPNGTPSAGNENTKIVVDFLKENGYTNVRGTYPLVKDTTGFSLPADRYAWSYNADHTNLLTYMKQYEALADDGELKFFSFGVHAIDYLSTSKAHEGSRIPLENLYIFARTYGYRPEDYYYATVDDIFAYEDAVKALTITESEVINNSNITLYIKANGKNMILQPLGGYNFVKDISLSGVGRLPDSEEPVCEHTNMSEWEQTTPATCVAEGAKTRHCLADGCEYSETAATPTIAHDMSYWMEVTAPTCSAEGVKSRYCLAEKCEYIETAPVPMTDHDMGEFVITTPATCTADGEKVATCKNGCGHTESEVVAKKGHSMSDFVVTTPATCTEDGVKTSTCQNGCGLSETKTVQKTGHSMSAFIVTTPATCTETGVETSSCQRGCGLEETHILPALNHDMGEWVAIDENTKKRECARCDHFETKSTVNDDNIDNEGWTKG